MESNHSDIASSSSSATKQEGSSSQSQTTESVECKSSSDKNSNPIYSSSNDESSKNEQEETKEIVDNDMKFAKNIIVTCDGSEEDGNSKYLTRDLVEECDRKLAFVMFK